MGFEIKVPNKLRRIAAVFDEKQRTKVKHALEKSLEEEITHIRLRTQRGIDVEDKNFRSYSPQYLKYRTDKGRNASTPDLTFTGRMLAAMRSKVTHVRGYLEGTIFFLSSQRIKAKANNETREFFGLSKEQLVRITEKIRKALNE